MEVFGLTAYSRLKTVTYGVSSAPFLALCTLVQLAKDEASNYLLASIVLSNSTYIDDILAGAESVEEALSLQSELIDLLKQGGFELRKWAANHCALLKHFSSEECQQDALSFDSDDAIIQILGLQWLPSLDTFNYSCKSFDRPCTKRSILSELARIFNPLGFLSPLSCFVKCLLQYLWASGLDWDDTPPENVVCQWIQFKNELVSLNDLRIPRRLIVDHFLSVEVHGFCDSSEKAYACVIYFRFLLSCNQIKVLLICGKSKVDPNEYHFLDWNCVVLYY